MATETTQTEKAPNDGSQDEAWIGQMLPIIRIRSYGILPLLPKKIEIVALYPDEIVIAKARLSAVIPESAYETDGASTLREIRGWSVSVPIDQIRKVVSIPRSIVGQDDSLKIVGQGRSARCKLTQAQAPNLYRALSIKLGTRFVERRTRPPFGSYAMTTLLALLIGSAIFLGRLGPGSPADSLAGSLWMIAAVLTAIGIAFWIPGRRKAPRKAKKGPLKDLSGRQPVRFRVAGFALNALGSILVCYYFADLFYNALHPAIHARVHGEGPWYLKLFTAAWLCFALVVGGSSVFASAGSLAIALAGLGFLFYLGLGIFALVMRPSAEVFYSVLQIFGAYFGLVCIYTGRRLISRSATTAIHDDPRRPILYLRSFEDDVEDTLTPHTGLARFYARTVPADVRKQPLLLRVLFELQPLRLLRSLFGRVSPSTELQMAEFFRKIGPFIAIGKPGERLRPEGAARDYVPEPIWKDVVLDYLDHSRYVVLQAAATANFLWELKTVLARVEPERILFCLSNFQGRQDDYENFRLNAESVDGWSLPRSVGNHDEPQFVFFRADRSPVLRAVSYRSPLSWPVASSLTDLDYTLADFVDRDRPARCIYEPRKYPGHAFGSLILTLTIAPALGGLLMYLVIQAASLIIPASGGQDDPFLEPQVPAVGDMR